MPDSFPEILALYEVLFETTTGTRLRTKEREEEREAAKQSAAYQKSVAELKRRQEQE